MVLNMLANEPYEIDERGFWIQFFDLLVAKGRYTMPPKLVSIMAWILSQDDPDVCWVSVPHVNTLMKSLKVQRPEISVFKDTLLELKLIYHEKKPGKRLNTRLAPELLNLKKKFNSGEVIDLRFTLIKKNEDIRSSNKSDSKGLSDESEES